MGGIGLVHSRIGDQVERAHLLLCVVLFDQFVTSNRERHISFLYASSTLPTGAR